MITAQLRDGLTAPVVSRQSVPGMDSLYWRETDTEESLRRDLSSELNAAMRSVAGSMALDPWPQKVPLAAPVDYGPLTKGMSIDLHHRDRLSGERPPIPAAAAQVLDESAIGLERRELLQGTALLTPAEVRASVSSPTEWIRLPFGNETGGTRMEQPVQLMWRAKGAAFRAVLADNDIWTPFDLTHDDWYQAENDDGEVIDKRFWLDFRQSARYVLYLRPRRWRWVVTCVAHFYIVTLFELVQNDEIFIQVFYTRPPYFPYRWDPTSRDTAPLWHPWVGSWLSFDTAVDWRWGHSLASEDMRHQIYQQQYVSLCASYLFAGNEDPAAVIERVAPRRGELVLGIGRMDNSTGQEHRIWVRQVVDLGSVYPQTVIGSYYFSWSA